MRPVHPGLLGFVLAYGASAPFIASNLDQSGSGVVARPGHVLVTGPFSRSVLGWRSKAVFELKGPTAENRGVLRAIVVFSSARLHSAADNLLSLAGDLRSLRAIAV